MLEVKTSQLCFDNEKTKFIMKKSTAEGKLPAVLLPLTVHYITATSKFFRQNTGG